jgi:hypothetical protein
MDNKTREERLKAYQEAVKQVLGGSSLIAPNTESDKDTLKKGDIFYTSWGYDQTNYDYIVVLEVSKTGKTVKCQRTSALHMGESCQSNVQEPVFCPFGDIFTMQVRTGYKGDICLKGSYPFCHDGSMKNKRLDSFSRHIEGKQYHETMSQFGH